MACKRGNSFVAIADHLIQLVLNIIELLDRKVASRMRGIRPAGCSARADKSCHDILRAKRAPRVPPERQRALGVLGGAVGW